MRSFLSFSLFLYIYVYIYRPRPRFLVRFVISRVYRCVHVAAIRIKIERNHAGRDYWPMLSRREAFSTTVDDGRTRNAPLLYDIMEMMGCWAASYRSSCQDASIKRDTLFARRAISCFFGLLGADDRSLNL